jgi:methyl-accepting chemotaxis protein
MSIGRKLYTSFGSILGILVLLILVSYLAIDREHSARGTAGVSLQEIQMIEAMRFQMMQNRLSLRNFLLSGDRKDETNELKGIAQLSEMMKEAQSKTAFDQLRSTYASIEETEHSWVEQFAKPLMDKRHQMDAGQATLADLHATYLQRSPGNWVTTEVKELDDSERVIRKELETSDAAANTAAKLSAILLTIGTIFAALLGVFIAYRTSLSITEPLTQLTEKTRQVAETGDLDQKIEIQRDDEFGALAEHHRNMMEHVKEMARLSSSIAGGQLNVAIQPRSARDTMANGLLQMLHGLRDLVRKVRESASQVANGASQMAAASSESAKVSVDAASAIDEVTSTMHEMSINVQNVVKSTQMQSSSVAETSASVDEMVASINRVADTARTLLEISQRSREEVHTGIQTMEKATRGLTRTSSAIRSSADIIDILGHRADEIGKIIEVIDDLAEQTNLLALNAAIEAARAGEHGLGFAVVAEEVRKLAEKSTQSTKEISDLIQGIQKEAREAVENMEKSTAMVQEGLDLGGELSSALGKISDVVSEVFKFAQQIGAATSEQSTGSTQIAKATTRLTEITQEINSTIEEQASGAQSVVRAMEKMRDLVQQSTSSSTQLAATAEQMSKLSKGLLDSMDQFVTEENATRRPGLRAASRNAFGRERSSSAKEHELARI